MKKNYKTFIASCLAIIGLGIAQPASTQPLLNESFDYAAGNLYNQGDWWRYGTATENPIQTTGTGLTYAGYQDENVGRAAELGNLPLSESLVKKFTEGSEAITSGTLYYSALIQVKSAEEEGNSILAFVQKTYSSDVADGKKGNEYGKLFVKKGSNDSKFTLGVERYLLSPAMTAEEYDINQTYLVVVKYEFVDGSNNDVISLFVNPADLETEPAEASAVFNGESRGDVNANLGIQGIELRQGATTSKPAANVIIDELRVATSYAALFDAETDTPAEPQPQIVTDPSYIGYNSTFAGLTYESTLNVKAENLKGDITIAPLASGEVTLSTMTITKEQAEAEEGFDLTVTLNPKNPDVYSDNIVLSSEGAEDVTVMMFWSTTAAEEVADLATLAGKDPEAYGTYLYTGEAIVTFIDSNTYYIQDATGGFRINNTLGDLTDLGTGDCFTNFICTVEESFGLYALPAYGAPQPQVTATGQTVEPAVLTLAELEANLDRYVNVLVQVKNVTLPEDAGATFTEDMTNPLISDGTGEGRLNLFDGTDIIGTTAPTAAFTLTGISTSAAAPVVGPRALTDIEVSDTPAEPQPQIITDQETIYPPYSYVYIGLEYEVTLNVKAENLKGDITIAPLATGEVALSTMTITKEQAEAEEGFDLAITLRPTDASIMEETITLSSEGAEDVSVTVSWWPIDVIDVPDLGTLAGKDASLYETYRYTGKAIVTFVDGNNYYLQDETGGFRVNNEYGGFEGVNAGDEFTNFYCNIESFFGAMYALPSPETPQPQVTATGQTVEPAVLTLAELEANLDRYVNVLVQVKNVTLPEDAGATFTEDMTNPLISDGTGEGRLNLFDGTDIIGTTAPTAAFTLTGISTSAGAPVVGPRALTDIEAGDVRIEDALANGLSIKAQEGSICIQGNVAGKMEVFDITGRKVAETEEKEIRMDSPAIYVVKFTTDEGSIIQKLYVK